MYKRGTTWNARTLGARIAALDAATPEAKAAAEADGVTLRTAMAACSDAIGAAVKGSDSPDATVRTRAVAGYAAWLQREMEVGEPEACRELAARQK
jgi:hypothetical protein